MTDEELKEIMARADITACTVEDIRALIGEAVRSRVAAQIIVCAWCGKVNERVADEEATNAMIRDHILTECPNNGLGQLVDILSEFVRCFELIADEDDMEPKAAKLARAALGVYDAAKAELPQAREAGAPPVDGESADHDAAKARSIFLTAWDEAKKSPEYSKETWRDLRAALKDLGVSV